MHKEKMQGNNEKPLVEKPHDEKPLSEGDPMNVDDQLKESIMVKINLLAKALGDNEKAIAKIKEQIAKMPDREMMEKILDYLEKAELRQVAVNRDFKSVGTVFMENYQKDGKLAAVADKLINTLNGHDAKFEMNVKELKEWFEKPLKKSVHYTHFLGKPLWVVSGMILFLGVVVYLGIRVSLRAERYEENDIKWRYVKVTFGPNGLQALQEADSIYLADPENFRKAVNEEELRLRHLAENTFVEQKAHEEIQDLEKNKKPLPGR